MAIGLTLPYTAIEILRQRLTPACFQRAAALAEQFSPANAVEAGFLDRVVEPAELAAAARETAQALSTLDMTAHTVTKQRARASALAAIRAGIEADRAARNPVAP